MRTAILSIIGTLEEIPRSNSNIIVRSVVVRVLNWVIWADAHCILDSTATVIGEWYAVACGATRGLKRATRVCGWGLVTAGFLDGDPHSHVIHSNDEGVTWKMTTEVEVHLWKEDPLWLTPQGLLYTFCKWEQAHVLKCASVQDGLFDDTPSLDTLSTKWSNTVSHIMWDAFCEIEILATTTSNLLQTGFTLTRFNDIEGQILLKRGLFCEPLLFHTSTVNQCNACRPVLL